MIVIQISLVYAIIHLLCVLYLFNMFDAQHYVPDELDYLIVWSFAPLIVVIMFMKLIVGGKL